MKKYTLTFLCFLSISLICAQFNYRPNQIGSSIQLTGEDYITGEDGVPRMNINVWGHVKYPGSYLVYDGIDLLTCLSMAGGPLKGAKLSKISIISIDGNSIEVNLDDFMYKYQSNEIVLKPHDTIYIDETLGNYLLARSNVINILLQITNLILISINNN
tara:strand:+ start:89 stop:565 length:477 start_codon:yes stop_codon:yes gene_type:complete